MFNSSVVKPLKISCLNFNLALEISSVILADFSVKIKWTFLLSRESVFLTKSSFLLINQQLGKHSPSATYVILQYRMQYHNLDYCIENL